MTYTYDDFLKAANKEGMMNLFSDEDLKLAQEHPEYGISMLSLHKDAANATTDDARLLASEAMKQLRSNYAPVTAPAAQPAGTGSFVYDNEAAYKEALGAVLNGKPFEYNHETDPTYGAFAKTYLREGQRATEDTLARVAAANGGAVPTSAVTAATQAGDYYAAQLADKVPQLQQQAYNNYLNEEQMKQARLNVLAADRQQKQNDWQLNYNVQNAERDRLMQLMTSLGYEPTAEELAAAGISEAEAMLYTDYYKKATSSGGGIRTMSSAIRAEIDKVYNSGGDTLSYLDYLYKTGVITQNQWYSAGVYYKQMEDQRNSKHTLVDSVSSSFSDKANKISASLGNVKQNLTK